MGPIFIVGFFRSGTTAMAEGLRGLGRFGPYGEGHFVDLLAGAVNKIADGTLNANSILRKPGVAQSFLEGLAGTINALYSATGDRADTTWIDKTPGLKQIQAVPALATLYPGARFVYMYRPAVDAVRSSVAMPAWKLAGKEKRLADRWVACQAAWRKVRGGLPDAAPIEVYQPQMLSAPDEVATALAGALGLSTVEATQLATFWATNREIARSPSHTAPAQPFAMSDDVAREIDERAASEMSHWARLASTGR